MTRLSFIALVIAACSPAPVMRPRADAPPEDDWKRSAVWLHATSDSPSGHEQECRHVRGMLDAERRCKGALCKHSADLASEWLDKCAEIMAADVDTIADLQAAMSEEAERKPSQCFKRFKRFLDDGCDEEHCVADAQAWATRCGETEGSPLVVSMVATVVDRHTRSEKAVKLDTRSCASLEEELEEGAECDSEKACKKLWKVLETHRKRCLDPNELPDIVAGMRQLSIATGAVRDIDEALKVAAEPRFLDQEDLPLVLADGAGAVLAVCHKRVFELEAYLDARAACDGGFVYVARAFGEGDEREIRTGEVPLRKDWDAFDMFPSMVVAGEATHLAEQEAASLAAALDDAIERTSLAKLVTAVDEHARWIFRSTTVRSELSQRDEQLADLLVNAAKSKVNVASGGSADQRRAIWAKGQRYAFGDLSRDGKVNTAIITRASWVRTDAIMPEATEAYLAALQPLRRKMQRDRPPGRQTLADAETAAMTAAEACAQAQSAAQTASAKLATCVFDGCEDQELQDLVDAREQALEQELLHLHNLLTATSRVGSKKLNEIAKSASCKPPSF